MGTSLHQTIKFCSWLTGVYSGFNQATYFCVLSRFSMTHNKGKKCASLYPLESMEHSNGKKLFRLDWKKAIYQPLFALGGYGIHVHESRFSAFQQERKSQTKSIGKMFFFASFGKSPSNRHYADWLTPCVYKFQYGLCNESYYAECVRRLNVRIDEHISISPLTKKQVKPKNFATIQHPMTILVFLRYENKKILLELKESLLIMRDKPSLNRNITLAPLYLFDRP